jgi:predicted dehydrogenase
MTIKVGFVGLSAGKGWASSAIAPPLLSEPLSQHYALTATCTSSAESARATAEHYSALIKAPVKAYHGGTKELAQDENIDLVIISVKVPHHYETVMPVLQAGKNVFLEWPLGRGMEEARDIARIAREKGLKTIVGTQGWQLPFVRKVADAFLFAKDDSSLLCLFFGLDQGSRGVGGYRQSNERDLCTSNMCFTKTSDPD